MAINLLQPQETKKAPKSIFKKYIFLKKIVGTFDYSTF